MNVCIDGPRVVGNGKKVNALPRRARLARARRGPRARERRARESDEGDANDGVVFDDERCARGVRASGGDEPRGKSRGTLARGRAGDESARAGTRGDARTGDRRRVRVQGRGGARERGEDERARRGRGRSRARVVLEVGVERVHGDVVLRAGERRDRRGARRGDGEAR